MVAYLEKTYGNAKFHEIIDFFTRSSIHYALTVSPVVSTTFVEQFWMTAKSKTIDNVRSSSSNLILDSIPEGSGGNHGGQSSSDRSITTQAAQIKDLKSQIKQLKKKAKHVISHHNAWIKSVSMKKRLARKNSLKKKLMQKESVSKQGRKSAKSKPTVHKDLAFDDFDDIVDDAMDYIETEDS
ncbi:hypothetical protein Tco_0845649 [Tanacetum coccineum]